MHGAFTDVVSYYRTLVGIPMLEEEHI